MNAIFLKELRENAKWALLLMLGIGAFMVYTARHDTQPPLVSGEMQATTAIGFSVAAFALGLLQVLQDHWRGRWGFLIQRPLSRSRIFMAKVLAGMALYIPITVIPLILATMWIATPGHVAAPFDWRMILPRLADLIGGAAWYLAGVLVAARMARWVGSRLLPAGLAFIAAVLAAALTFTIFEAILIYLAAILLLLPAAWGALIYDGEYENEPIIIRLTQAAGVLFGVFIVYGFFFAIVGNMIEYYFPDSHESRSYFLLDDGSAMVVHNNGMGAVVAEDRAGRALRTESARGLTARYMQSVSLDLGQFSYDRGERPMRIQLEGLQSQPKYVRPVFLQYDPTRWYYVVSRRTVEGFNTHTNWYAGSISPAGFSPPDQAAVEFPQLISTVHYGYQSGAILVGTTAAYSIDLPELQARTLFMSALDDQILDANQLVTDSKLGTPTKSFYVVATRKIVCIIFPDGRSFSVPLEHDWPDYRAIEIGQATNGRFILHYEPSYDQPHRNIQDWVVQVDDLGQIVQRDELPILPATANASPDWKELAGVSVFPPAVLTGVVIANLMNDDFERKMVALEAVFAAALSAALAYLALRRYDSTDAERVAWMIACALLGLPGVLLLICMRQPVAKVKCPACGKPRFVTQEKCAHCAEPFAEPARQGIEVIEMT